MYLKFQKKIYITITILLTVGENNFGNKIPVFDVTPKCNVKMFPYEFFYEVKQRKPSGEFLLLSQLFFRFLHTFELWRWQLFRSILTVITYFCVILLVVLVIAGYYKVDIDSKLAALLKTFLCLRSRPVRHSKDCNTV